MNANQPASLSTPFQEELDKGKSFVQKVGAYFNAPRFAKLKVVVLFVAKGALAAYSCRISLISTLVGVAAGFTAPSNEIKKSWQDIKVVWLRQHPMTMCGAVALAIFTGVLTKTSVTCAVGIYVGHSLHDLFAGYFSRRKPSIDSGSGSEANLAVSSEKGPL